MKVKTERFAFTVVCVKQLTQPPHRMLGLDNTSQTNKTKFMNSD